jgi:anti-anti-sigma factor
VSDETANLPISGSADLRVMMEADWACAWVKPAGEVDLQTAPRLLQAIEEVMDRGPRKIHLLLDHVSFSGPGREGVLAQARTLTEARGVKLMLHCPRPRARTSWLTRARLLGRQSLDGHDGEIVGLTTPSSGVGAEHVIT